jgi:GNAT superfamily N-acetyltransferase
MINSPNGSVDADVQIQIHFHIISRRRPTKFHPPSTIHHPPYTIHHTPYTILFMEIKIRKAIASDCENMMVLIRELAAFERAPDEVTVKLEHFIETGFGKNPVWHAFVASDAEDDDEQIIGISLYYMRYSTWKGLKLYLEDLIVTEKFRGKGIGKKLFDCTVEEARKMKVNGMMWQVLDWNKPAIDFYNKYGADISSEWLNCSLKLEA